MCADHQENNPDSPEFQDTLELQPDSIFETGLKEDTIGVYQLIRKIDAGGMGTVYEALQTGELNRRVALKVIRSQCPGEEILKRFEIERRVLALMKHPNIAQVFDAGSTDHGLPYFVMELVDGKPVHTFCDEHKLNIRQRIDLFLDICSGVLHAHQKGILHRDIKAANILVTEVETMPVPKIIDFGIAKAIHRIDDQVEMDTRFGQLVGTPDYMSPEQAVSGGKDIDVRSDVYSLGVLLYLLVLGRMPFPREGTGRSSDYELLVRIVTEEPRPFYTQSLSNSEITPEFLSRRTMTRSEMIRALNGDLKWIVMKCLEKERSDRYESVSELASDLKRFLEHEPTVARPPDMVDRCRKFYLRHKLGVLSGITIAIALFAGVIGTTWGMLKARKAEYQALQEAERASIAREQASKQRNLALNTLDTLVREVNDELSTRSDLNGLRLSLLDMAVDGLKEVTRLSGTDLNAEKNLVIGNQTISSIFVTARREKEAREAIDQAITTCKTLYAQFPEDPEIKFLFAKTYKQAGYLAHNFRLGDLEEARMYFKKALDILVGNNQFQFLNHQQKSLAVRLYSELGDVDYDRGDYQRAEDTYRFGLKRTQALRKELPDEIELAYLERELLSALGDIANVNEDFETAGSFFQKAFDKMQTFPEEEQRSPKYRRSLALTYFDLGEVARYQDKLDESQRDFEHAEAILKELLKFKPTHVQWRRDLIVTVFRMGDLARANHQWKHAIKYFSSVLDQTADLIQMNPENAEAHRDQFMGHLRLGDLYLDHKEFQNAENAYYKAQKRAEWLLGHNPDNVGSHMDHILCFYKLSVLYNHAGKKTQALKKIDEAIAMLTEYIDKNTLPKSSPFLGWIEEFRNLKKSISD